MRQQEFRLPRTCARCRRQFSPEEVRARAGWTPVRSGWRCPACSREHLARIDALAEELVAGHRRWDWAGTSEHAPHDECVFCEAIAAATERLLRRGAAGG